MRIHTCISCLKITNACSTPNKPIIPDVESRSLGNPFSFVQYNPNHLTTLSLYSTPRYSTTPPTRPSNLLTIPQISYPNKKPHILQGYRVFHVNTYMAYWVPDALGTESISKYSLTISFGLACNPSGYEIRTGRPHSMISVRVTSCSGII